ncbi:MAG TPA: hypothetical protein VFV52_06130 [Bacilli bacterium]|nr:hypothetical protein [Bacilli bacterium]
MSLWFKSPMPKLAQVFFFVYVLVVMGLFGLVGVEVAKFHYGLAMIILLANVLIVGFGFMIRKRVLRASGLLPSNQ